MIERANRIGSEPATKNRMVIPFAKVDKSALGVVAFAGISVGNRSAQVNAKGIAEVFPAYGRCSGIDQQSNRILDIRDRKIRLPVDLDRDGSCDAGHLQLFRLALFVSAGFLIAEIEIGGRPFLESPAQGVVENRLAVCNDKLIKLIKGKTC